MFEIGTNTYYGSGIGRAVIFMNRNSRVGKIDFIYKIDENKKCHFHYLYGICLYEEDRIELEDWFITHCLKKE